MVVESVKDDCLERVVGKSEPTFPRASRNSTPNVDKLAKLIITIVLRDRFVQGVWLALAQVVNGVNAGACELQFLSTAWFRKGTDWLAQQRFGNTVAQVQLIQWIVWRLRT